MDRTEAMKISDALAELGETHSISVRVSPGYLPRDAYSVHVTPSLTYSPDEIGALQRLGDKLGYKIALVSGSFIFTKAG